MIAAADARRNGRAAALQARCTQAAVAALLSREAARAFEKLLRELAD